ncbi:MAG: cytochrome C [Candidatus Hydrogenedentes bacterium]|nr:cytochrome C [Candidatus Hydrogenedentota bacterium]
MIQKLVVTFFIVAALVCIGAAVVFMTGPRMRWQASLRSFDAPVPPMPPGVVQMPTPAPAPAPLTISGQTYQGQSPLDAVKAGSTYYGYYCTYCHGENGDGNGPVGQSYVPKPSDLRTPQVQQLSDAGLLKAMLTGTGHEPVLNRIVPEEHRLPLVYYVRHLGSTAPPQSEASLIGPAALLWRGI